MTQPGAKSNASSQRGRSRPRLIMMSGHEPLTDQERAALGADAILTKPFSREELIDTIKAVHRR